VTAAHPPGFLRALDREWTHLRLDHWDLALVTWLPALACALVLWIFSAGVPRHLPIAVVDQDHSVQSRHLTRLLEASPAVTIAAGAPDLGTALDLVERRQAFGVLVIPDDFARQLLLGRQAHVQWLYNAQFSPHSGMLTNAVRSAVGTMSAGIEIVALEKRGAAPVVAATQFEPLRGRTMSLFIESNSYEPFLAASIVPALLQIFAMVAAASAVGRELKHGTVLHWRRMAGGWTQAVAAKLLIPLVSLGLTGLASIAWLAVVRGWTIEGSVAALAVGEFLMIFAYLALGVLAVGIALSVRGALSMAGFYTAPGFAFSGHGFPVFAMPPMARFWANLLPLTHYLVVQNRHWLMGAPLGESMNELALLAAVGAGALGIGVALLIARAGKQTAWGRR
jgi:ABC-2 type transport system permease protein